MTKKLFEIAADIAQAQASVGQMSSDDIQQILSRTFTTLQKMQKAEEGGTFLEENKTGDLAGQSPSDADSASALKLDPRSSIQEDKIICLECGLAAKQLTSNHLKNHDLSPRDYKKKYGFPLKQSLSAKSLARARSKAAKKRGIPENLALFIENRRKQKLQPMPVETVSEPQVEPAPVPLDLVPEVAPVQAPVKATRTTKPKTTRKKKTAE